MSKVRFKFLYRLKSNDLNQSEINMGTNYIASLFLGSYYTFFASPGEKEFE